jgi:hypothetical protein
MTVNRQIRNEEILLVCLCRLEFSVEKLEELKSLLAKIADWDYFKRLANSHGVSALVFHNLEINHLLEGIPDPVVNYLRNSLMINLSRNTFNTESMYEVLHLLNREDIRTVILKGMALENSVYGKSGLRQMSDVDILIEREKCLKARDILTGNGYVSLPMKSFFHKLILPYSGKHLPSVTKNGTSVEIHHELFGGRNSRMTRILFETSYEAEIKGEKAWFPKPQIFFLYLIKHLWLHEESNESQLRLYTDLIVLIEKHKDEIFNHDLLKLADRAEMSEILANHLRPLRDFWGISFPDWLSDFTNNLSNEDSLKKFIFFLGSPKDNPLLEKHNIYRQIIKDIPGLHRKFLYVLGDIFPSLSFMKNRYGCESTLKVLMYYPHRLGKISWLFRK